MKYKVRVSELYYGAVTVEAASEEEAKTIAASKEINYFDKEITDMTAEPFETNADKVRKMDDDELARFLVERCGCPPDKDSEICTTGDCDSCWARWLQKDADDDRTYIVTELCPHCQSEIEMRWNTDTDGYKAFCPVCGKRLMLCDECRHTEGMGGCDYDNKTDTCKNNK